MNSHPAATITASAHLQSHQSGILHRILDPGVNLCLWQRPSQTAITQELAALQGSKLVDKRLDTSRETFDTDTFAWLQLHGFDPADFPNFQADLRQLADIFFQVSKDFAVKFRLLTTDEDDCRRFHVDYRHLRLLCTYQGPGTEWLADSQVDRAALESGQPNESILRFGKPRLIEPFWVAILKDDAYPGNTGQGLVHRSPPIEDTGQTRVLFCMDAVPRERTTTHTA